MIYTHSILDQHPTHIGVALKVIEALRRLSKEYMPEEFYGCEVWRGLDWISNDKKVGFDMSNHLDLQKGILDVFESQIAGGKSYTEASIGRRYANATYFQSHSVDSYKLVNYGAPHFIFSGHSAYTPMSSDKPLLKEKPTRLRSYHL